MYIYIRCPGEPDGFDSRVSYSQNIVTPSPHSLMYMSKGDIT